ncbi:MAG: nucleoside triphosphate pyrophosphohydrolase [Anaerolineae bacterium]|nr:nucleoside triphosphate pyrophosphohydrolase [Anaerolineae bacterium]
MAMITIVGLGPGRIDHLTREAWAVLSAAEEVWLRTRHHPTVAGLPQHLTLRSFDHLYEAAEDFGAVYQAIGAEVLQLGQRPQGAVYAVPGHPRVGESTAQHVLDRAGEAGVPVRIVEGLGFVEPALTALGIDALAGLQIHDGIELAALHHPPLNPDLAALIGQVYSRALASDLKLTLMNQYPDDHPVTLLYAVGTSAERRVDVPLYELDRLEVDHLTSLYVPPLPAGGSFEALQETVAHLRAPDGCPWDREQTYESLRGDILEEAYEAVSAIDDGDMEGLKEELGDLLLQVLLQAQIATEEGVFQMADVIAAINAKLKHRHPHVWGERVVNSEQELLAQWESLKKDEREAAGVPASVLDGVPPAIPALQKAYIYGERAARVGFDWPGPEGVVEKVQEEMGEISLARTPEEVEAELGDLLFAVVNWSRHLAVDPETALRRASERFAARFRAVEELARQRGFDWADMSAEQMDALWEEVKTA